MVEVRIRPMDDARSSHLTDVPFEDVDTVIPTLRSWGIADLEDKDLSGQFVVRGEGDREGPESYFEIVIEDV